MESKCCIHGQLQAEGERSGRGPAFQLDHFRCPSAARIASRPSVSAAGPGRRISADLISTMQPLRTAGIASQQGRCRILSKTTFLPHQEARMTSGAAAITSSGEMIRSLAALCFLSSGNTSSVADEPEGETDQDQREGGEPWALHRIPNGRGRHPEKFVRRHPAADRGTAATARSSARVKRSVAMRLSESHGRRAS
jgi:hypothetical protein